MTHKIDINVKQVLVAVFAASILAVTFVIMRPQAVDAQSGACSTLPSDRGLATHTESGVGAGDYTVFARVKVASGDATFDLSIDGDGGSLCNHQVTQAGSNGNWVWYSSGNTTVDWSGGDMRFQMSGDKNGVGLDCIVLFDLTQASFDPSTREDCNPSTGTTDSGAAATGATATAGCDVVSGPQAVNAVQSFLRRTVLAGSEVFDADSNNDISGPEAVNAVSKFLNRQCP